MPAKEISQQRTIGIVIGMILFGVFQIFLYSASQVDIGSQLRGLETDKAIDNPVYVLSAALFIFVLSVALVILWFVGKSEVVLIENKAPLGCYFVLLVSFLFLCVPTAILSEHGIPAFIFLLSPFVGIIVGRFIVRSLNQKFTLTDEERGQLRIICAVTFLIVSGIAQSITGLPTDLM